MSKAEQIGCDCANNTQQITFTENIEGLDEWPMSKNWKFGTITYRLNNYTTDIIEKWQERAVTVAHRIPRASDRRVPVLRHLEPVQPYFPHNSSPAVAGLGALRSWAIAVTIGQPRIAFAGATIARQRIASAVTPSEFSRSFTARFSKMTYGDRPFRSRVFRDLCHRLVCK